MAYTKQTWTDRQGTKLNKFTKANETLTTVELTNAPESITQAGTPFSKTRMDYMEEGIRTGHVIGTPLSDLSRVMRINGDGVPMIPDDESQAIFTEFSSGWFQNQCTLTTADGITTLVTTGVDPFINKAFSFTGNANRFIRLIFDSPIDFQLEIYYATSSHTYSGSYNKVVSVVVGSNVIDVDMAYLSSGGNDWLDSTITGMRFDFGLESGRSFKIYGVYLGSGLYDTPVYGKDGQTVATNHGAVPINGKRGNGLLFRGNGAVPLVFNSPVVGVTGTTRLKFKTMSTFMDGYICGNTEASAGFRIFVWQTGAWALEERRSGDSSVYMLDALSANTEYTVSLCLTLTTLYVYINGAVTLTQDFIASAQQSQTPLHIGNDAEGPIGQNFILYDFEYVAEAETLDSHIRYHNGDDAVDSQQKAVTAVPHSIVTRDANGGINASNMFAYDLVIDSDAKLAQWAASGTYAKVLIKTGTWTLASGGVDLTARGTKFVVGEPGSKLVFSSTENGLYYTSLPTTNDYRMEGVTVETTSSSDVGVGFHNCTNLINCTGTGTGNGNGNGGFGFHNCTNLINCTGTGTGTGGFGTGFSVCTNLTNCTGTGTGTGSSGAGFHSCTNLTNCTGTGSDTGGHGYGFHSCTKCQQNKKGGTSTTSTYYKSYADAGTSYPCADTPNGGFNS